MIPEFDGLREDEIELLLMAPVYVSILIAGADDHIDDRERKEAIETARSKQVRARAQLIDYYQEVGNDFDLKMEKLIRELPDEVEQRTSDIISELRKLNRILPKVEKSWATSFYASLKDMAKRVAEASGGILGYLSVSYDEAKLVGLNMIDDPAK